MQLFFFLLFFCQEKLQTAIRLRNEEGLRLRIIAERTGLSMSSIYKFSNLAGSLSKGSRSDFIKMVPYE